MKPGSSQRCKERLMARTGLRCHRHKGHPGPHMAPQGFQTVVWETPPKEGVTK